MFKYYSAVLFGVTVGFISLIPLQAMNNNLARIKCTGSPDTHTLVSVRAFAGDADHCVGNAYLTPNRTVTHYGPAH
jgi:energy-converting hydrogenase Eha subunit G